MSKKKGSITQRKAEPVPPFVKGGLRGICFEECKSPSVPLFKGEGQTVTFVWIEFLIKRKPACGGFPVRKNWGI
jgi:hypothetical protein